jgi:hypothetical protein
VSHTRQHTRYQAAYDFTLENDDWTMAEGHGEWCKDLPHGTLCASNFFRYSHILCS